MQKKTILVLNRVSLIMNESLVEQFGEAATEDRNRAADLAALMLSKLQQAVNLALINDNPEACCRADVAWTDCGAISTTGLFIIATSADDEVTNHFEDSDYLCHLHTINRVAEDCGFKFKVEKLRVAFPFESTVVPEQYTNYLAG